jgi:PAS domain S-box-containing protein
VTGPDADRDIERRDADDDQYLQDLEAYRRRLDGAMFAGDLAWWEMDVETGAVEFHENKADMLGMSPSDFDHYEDFMELLHDDDHERAMDAMRDCLTGRTEKYDVEYRIRTADGAWRWFHDVGGVTERRADGSPAKVTGVVVDVTGRKEAEQRLRGRNEQLSLLNRIVRHDIRNDMAVINGWTEMLRTDAPPEKREQFDKVLGASEHTVELTKDVRDLIEMLDDEGDELSLESVALDRVVEEEIDRLRSSVDAVEVRVDGEIPTVEVEANALLSSVVGNLLTNAAQHADAATVRVDVDVEVGTETVVLRIGDDGPGIPAPRRDEVFQRGTHGLDSDGSGIGLYLVDTLVDAYGGDVWIEDNDPSGTVFAVELRRDAPA